MYKTTIALAAIVLVSGCATSSPTPNYDARFGEAVRTARQRMALNPTPSTDPMTGMDGRASREAIVRYQDSYKAPPPVVNVINIGGAVRAGAN